MEISEAPPGLVDGVVRGEPRAIARAISLVENGSREAGTLLGELYARAGKALVVGITGPPGAGKSTLVDRLAARLRKAGRTVGIVAVDPTSPFSGGAILGDRVRMQAHASDPGVFIRSMATRGHLGGIAATTGRVVTVLDAAGKAVILVETVGVGQDEVEVVGVADVSLVVLVPGLGDEIQSLKAGIMEIADLFVVNKADREGADRVVAEVESMLSLVPAGGPRPPILKTAASEDRGIAELLDAIDAFHDEARRSGLLARKRRAQAGALLRRELEAKLSSVARSRVLTSEETEVIVDRLVARDTDPQAAVDSVVRRLGLA